MIPKHANLILIIMNNLFVTFYWRNCYLKKSKFY